MRHVKQILWPNDKALKFKIKSIFIFESVQIHHFLRSMMDVSVLDVGKQQPNNTP